MNYQEIMVFISALFLFGGCSKHTPTHERIQPAKVIEPQEKGGIPNVVLTSEAQKRLGIISRTFKSFSESSRIIPVSALIYDLNGLTWVYVESKPLEFHRAQIQILKIENNLIHMNSQISDSTAIVIQGAAELNGTESGVGK